MDQRVMIVGYGSTGKYVLDMLVRLPDFTDCEYIVVSRTEKVEAEKRINLTLVSAGIFGNYPKVRYRSCDINNVEQMSELLSQEKPDIIAYTGRYMKGFKYGEFSYPNQIGYGVWTPLAVVLVEKLMDEGSGIHTRVINTSLWGCCIPSVEISWSSSLYQCRKFESPYSKNRKGI